MWICWTSLTPGPQTVCCRPLTKLPGRKVLCTPTPRAVVGQTIQHVVKSLSKIWPVVRVRSCMCQAGAATTTAAPQSSRCLRSNHWRHATTTMLGLRLSSNHWRHPATRLALRSTSSRFQPTFFCVRYTCVCVCRTAWSLNYTATSLTMLA